MFDPVRLQTELANLLGWKQHFDSTEIDVPVALQMTDSGEYYQQKHPALRLDLVQALIPDNYDLFDYLEDKISDSIAEMINDLMRYRNVNQYGATLLKESTLLNKYGFLRDLITNESRFVGWQIRIKTASGVRAIINEIGLQFSGVENFNLYLFHSQKQAPIATIPVTTSGSGQWDWSGASEILHGFNFEQYNGGLFVLGYYQDDLVSNAINMTNFNWDKGACGSCNRSNYLEWESIQEYYNIYPLYVPNGQYVVGEMFDLNDALYTSDFSWGMNLRLSVQCDLTEFFVRNKFSLTNLLGNKVAYRIINDMKFSQQINFIEENIKMMIIRDLEGDLETRMDNLTQRYMKELKAVAFNFQGINEKCLPCEDENTAPYYGVI